MPTLDIMFIVAWGAMLCVGIGLVVFGALQVKGRKGEFKVKEREIAARGGIAGGVACLIIGAILMTGAATLALQAGSNLQSQTLPPGEKQ